MNIRFLSFLFLIPLLTSCAHLSERWEYQSNHYSPSLKKNKKTVVILPFEDARVIRKKGHMGLSFIPFVPYATETFSGPEAKGFRAAAHPYFFRPKVHPAMSLAEELKASGFFSNVTYVEREENVVKADYVIKGILKRTDFSRRLYFYGLSVPGELLWLFGLPALRLESTIEVNLDLIDRRNGRTIWNYTVHETDVNKVKFWGHKKSVDVLWPQLLQEGYKKAVLSLESYLEKHSTSQQQQ